MGCLKSLIKSIIEKVIIVVVIVAFFMLGGWTFVKEKIHKYQNPTRDEFIKSETNYGDFSFVSGDYQLCRSFNLFGYKKVYAKYLPTGQKITIYDLKNESKISTTDFETGEIDNKINTLLDTFKDSIITFEDFKIIEKGSYKSQSKKIPYIRYTAHVKNIPFKDVTGIIAAYSTINAKAKNPSTKLIVTMTDTKAFNPVVAKSFIQAIKF